MLKNAVCVPKYQCIHSPTTNHRKDVRVKYAVDRASQSPSAIPKMRVEWKPCPGICKGTTFILGVE